MDKYPKWKYSANASLIVESADAEEALDGDWYDSPADIPDPEAAKADAPDHDALVAEAEALGIVVDKRWGDKRIAAEIVTAKADAE